MAAMVEYRGDGAGYLRWLVEDPRGHVVDVQRKPHRVRCSTAFRRMHGDRR